MADLSDVSNALGLLISDALYPGVTPNGASPVANVPVLVQVGWPDPRSLDKMVADAALSPPQVRAQVTVYPLKTERNTTRYPETPHIGPKQPKTFSLAQAGQVITVAGTEPAAYYRQNIGIQANGKPYIFSTVAGSTPSSIATGLAALMVDDIPGTSAAGAVLTLPDSARIGALRVGTGATISQEVKRQEREWQLTVWAPTVASRDAVAPPIDIAIARTPRLTLADQSRARLLYKGSPFTDFDQKQGIYRRDFIVTAEYPTIYSVFAPEVIAFGYELFVKADNPRLATESDMLLEDGSGNAFILTEADRAAFT